MSIQIVIYVLCIAFGFFNHSVYPQLRSRTPWKIFAKPILRAHEWDFHQFESAQQAKITRFEACHVWMVAIEKNLVSIAEISRQLRIRRLDASTYAAGPVNASSHGSETN